MWRKPLQWQECECMCAYTSVLWAISCVTISIKKLKLNDFITFFMIILKNVNCIKIKFQCPLHFCKQCMTGTYWRIKLASLGKNVLIL